MTLALELGGAFVGGIATACAAIGYGVWRAMRRQGITLASLRAFRAMLP